MTKIQTRHIESITLHGDQKGACSAEVGTLTPVLKKSATEPIPNFLKCKKTFFIPIDTPVLADQQKLTLVSSAWILDAT